MPAFIVKVREGDGTDGNPYREVYYIYRGPCEEEYMGKIDRWAEAQIDKADLTSH